MLRFPIARRIVVDKSDAVVLVGRRAAVRACPLGKRRVRACRRRGPVRAALDGNGSLTPLAGFDDWPHLVFKGAGIGLLGAPGRRRRRTMSRRSVSCSASRQGRLHAAGEELIGLLAVGQCPGEWQGADHQPEDRMS
jgi:hypothetical protein